MKINDTEVYDFEKIDEVYPQIPDYKRRQCEKLSAQGYYFFRNNSHAMDTARKWEDYDVIKVLRSHVNKPAVLWAVRDIGAHRAAVPVR
jgi:hypothetical protein